MSHDVAVVLQKAVQYRRWRDAGLPAVRIAVTFRRCSCAADNISDIEDALAPDDRAQFGLELEITESVIMEDVMHSIELLTTIRSMGVRIGIDDFGTGYSSLSYLSRLPLDTLKIDRSFIEGMQTSEQGLALVSTIINVGHSFGHCVVAEGVETEAQVNQLRLLGCDQMQGYLVSAPLPVAEFELRFLSGSVGRPAPVA